MREWEIICNWIKEEAGCPEDATFELVSARDGRLWIDVLSDTLAARTYERETNFCDPGWNTYELISTDRRYKLEKAAKAELAPAGGRVEAHCEAALLASQFLGTRF